MGRHQLLISILFSLSANAWTGYGADSTVFKGSWVTGAQFHAGFLMAHRPVVTYLQQNHARSFQCYAIKKTDGSKSWHHDYGRPLFGFSYRVTDWGNREEIGLGHSVVLMARFPLSSKSNRWESALDFGYGLGFIERPFDVETNYKNLASGSVLNAAFSVAISTSYTLSQHLRLRSGIDLLHFSNGAARMPNLGLNLTGVFLGVSYQFKPTGKPKDNPTMDDRTESSLLKGRESSYNRTRTYAAFGMKEIYPPNNGAYPIFAINAQHHRAIGKKGVFGGGFDLIHDSSLPAKISRKTDDPEKTGFSASFRTGVFGSAGIRMGPWSAYLQTGLYLVNPVKSDGDIYNRFALHYEFKQGLFLCMNLKSHFGKADYIEWGAGYSF